MIDANELMAHLATALENEMPDDEDSFSYRAWSDDVDAVGNVLRTYLPDLEPGDFRKACGIHEG